MKPEAASSAPVLVPSLVRGVPGAIGAWVDQFGAEPDRVGELISGLTALTLPGEPWNPAESSINPLRGDMESQFWFWNRAADNFVERGHLQAAAEIWSAHYLAYLSLQLRYHNRYHKGIPLCNIGFAFARARRPRLAVRSWLLGVIEDALTDISTAPDALSYQNLLKMRASPAVLDQLITTVESRFTKQDIVTMFPEMAVELWLHPTMVAPSEHCLKAIQSISEQLDRAYPRLPNETNPWEEILAPFWSFADWAAGVLNG